MPESLPTLRRPFLNENEHEVCLVKNPSEADTVSLKSNVETVKSGQRTKEGKLILLTMKGLDTVESLSAGAV